MISSIIAYESSVPKHQTENPRHHHPNLWINPMNIFIDSINNIFVILYYILSMQNRYLNRIMPLHKSHYYKFWRLTVGGFFFKWYSLVHLWIFHYLSPGLILGVGYCFAFNFVEYFESTFRISLLWKIWKSERIKNGERMKKLEDKKNFNFLHLCLVKEWKKMKW